MCPLASPPTNFSVVLVKRGAFRQNCCVRDEKQALEQLGENRPSGYRGILRDDLLARELYSEGAGIARTLPLAVAVPADADDVSPLVRWARASGYMLMPRGSASGMAAGAIGPGIALDLSRFRDVSDVDVANRRVRVGAGVVQADVNRLLRDVGLRFPVDPSSGAFCTIGGMAGTNAAGARTLRFGATRSWVTALECVFDDGSRAWIRRDAPLPLHIPAVARLVHTLGLLGQRTRDDASLLPTLVHAGVKKESSGYALHLALEALRAKEQRDPPQRDVALGSALVDLLVGSEGTLAVFTQVELALAELPQATGSVLALFDSLEAATECAVLAREAGATACELLDRTFLQVAASQGSSGIVSDIPAGTEAVLLIETEAESEAAAGSAISTIAQTLRTHGAREVSVALSATAQHELWALRHAASPILSRLAPRLRSMQFIEDGCVPPERLPEYVRGVRRILDDAGFMGVIFGHAGDAHMHVNPLVNVQDARWRERVDAALLAVCELTNRLGGTLAGEHGDGRLRAPLLPHVWRAPALAAFANVKAAADPTGVFNTGCKIAAPDDQLQGALRHDPGTRPLSTAARAVLDGIERERAWSRFRLADT